MRETMYFEQGKRYDSDRIANLVAMVMRRCTDDSNDFDLEPAENFEVTVKSVRPKAKKGKVSE